MTTENPKELPGYCKKSFAMFFNGGEIWIEHLDGIYGYTNLAIEKLEEDFPKIKAPSKPSLLAVNIDETTVSEQLIDKMAQLFIHSVKRFTRVVFVGANGRTKRQIRKAFSDACFALEFINDFERAKLWLVSEEN